MDEILRINGVTIRFGGLTAIHCFSAEINEGEIVGLIGPNGAGKTTLFNAVTGIYQPSAGKIFYRGVDMTKLKPHQIAHMGIARTFQNIRLFGDMSVFENVAVAKHHFLFAKESEKLRRLTGKADTRASNTWFWRNTLRMGYRRKEENISQDVSNILMQLDLEGIAEYQASSLPYGKRRLLEIARALATGADLLLLDEPAAGMNDTESSILSATVKSIRENFGVTIFLIDHDMRFVMNLCERLYVVDHGETIAQGVPEEILQNGRVVEAYLGEEWSDEESEAVVS